MELNKLNKVSATLTQDGIRIKVTEFSVRDSGKTYTSIGIRVNKDKILVVDTIFVNTLPSTAISYYTYCFYDDLNKAYDLLLKKISDRINEIEESLTPLKKGLSCVFYNS